MTKEIEKRGYCWAVGSAVVIATPCSECGQPEAHPPLEDQTKCGFFARCGVSDDTRYSGKREHGHACELEYKHEGRHTCPEALEECLEEHLAFIDSEDRLSAP